MRTVTTANSTYEINDADHLIRRVLGANDPTPRQGMDGQWRSYVELMPHFGGLLIVWGTNDDGTSACTWTSVIVSDVTT